LRLDVIAVVVGVLIVGSLVAGILTFAQAGQFAATAAFLTWGIHRSLRRSGKNARK